MMRRVVVIQSYVPAYRVPFFDALESRLSARGMSLVVAEGSPPPRLAHRGDARHGRWSVRVPSHWWGFGERRIGWRRVRSLHLTREDIVILPHEIRNLDSHALVLRPRRTRPTIALWGHGRTYSLPHSALRERLKQALTRRADWLFTYTDDGARAAVAGGFPAERITVLRNSIDTESLRRQLDLVGNDRRAAMRATLGLRRGRTALFLGGVDDTKGIDFLLAAAEAVRRQVPDFVLLIAGTGDMSGRVQSAARDCDHIRILGRVDGQSKAEALAVADIMLIPQWIGLVAVDSLVAGVPIVSTQHPSHSPEREYLVDEVTALFTEATVATYADGIVRLLHDPSRLASMQEECRRESEAFSIGAMADAFVRGLEQMDVEGTLAGGRP